MLMRSTGLGKTMLRGKVDSMQRNGDYLILLVDTVEPVQWRVRVAMNFGDLASVIKSCATASIMSFILAPKQWFNKEPKDPNEF